MKKAHFKFNRRINMSKKNKPYGIGQVAEEVSRRNMLEGIEPSEMLVGETLEQYKQRKEDKYNKGEVK
jgi:hypothetical protein